MAAAATAASAASAVGWLRSLRQCMADGIQIATMTHVQAGTVRADGDPAVRTLAFRDMVGDQALLFAVDARGDFAEDIRHRARAEIFPLSSEQFRFRCNVELVGESDTSHPLFAKRGEIWSKMSDDQRQVPGSDASLAPDHFLLAVCRPFFVDHLVLPPKLPPEKPRRTVQTLPRIARRFQYRREGDDWCMQQVNP